MDAYKNKVICTNSIDFVKKFNTPIFDLCFLNFPRNIVIDESVRPSFYYDFCSDIVNCINPGGIVAYAMPDFLYDEEGCWAFSHCLEMLLNFGFNLIGVLSIIYDDCNIPGPFYNSGRVQSIYILSNGECGIFNKAYDDSIIIEEGLNEFDFSNKTIEFIIRSWTNEGSTILNPFVSSRESFISIPTMLNRHFTVVDVSSSVCELLSMLEGVDADVDLDDVL